MALAELVFLICLALCVYVYFGYPALLVALGAVRRREVRRGDVTPAVALIVPTYNEERVIAGKLENSLALDYPRERLEILVVSDGSSDATEDIVRGYEARCVRLLPLARVGKAEALNQAVAACQGEILVFSDANAVLATDALRHLVANFQDRTVGGVCGNQIYRSRADDGSAGRGESLYWTYDKWIKSLESRLGSTVAAGGSIYAIRRQLYVPIAHPAQADDFAISARVVTQGYRLIFEERAVSHEESLSSSEREFRRRVRVANHSVRGILYLPEALNPWRHGFYAIELLSHKVLRYLVPFLLLAAFAANLVLAWEPGFYRLLLACQVLFYGSALIGHLLRGSAWGRLRIFYVPHYFCLANAAAFLGVLTVVSGKHITAWRPQRATAPLDGRRDLR